MPLKIVMLPIPYLHSMWTEENNALVAEFKFRDFSQAFAFMTEVAIAAEKMNHHPEWWNVYDTVRFRLCSHDAGNVVTDRDRRLATRIDAIAAFYEND